MAILIALSLKWLGMTDLASGLADLIEPTAPVAEAANSISWPIIVIVLMLLLASGAFALWRKQHAYRARIKRLQALRHTCQVNELARHEVVSMIALELRRGLKLARLLEDEIPEAFQASDIALWPDFIRRLDALRYQPEVVLDKPQLDALFTQTETWIRRYCR